MIQKFGDYVLQTRLEKQGYYQHDAGACDRSRHDCIPEPLRVFGPCHVVFPVE
ncbi:MAG: hypothetical protein JWM94_3105 [Sphingomonas bacterium]|nr:hypothetical protein [Sphingomonas bacterium]